MELTISNLDRIREIVSKIAKIDSIGPDDDLQASGLTSLNSLTLLIELETIFDISIPDELFIEARTPRQLAGVVDSLAPEDQLQCV